MNFLYIFVGLALVAMGIYTFTVIFFDWISISIAVAQIAVGIFLVYLGWRPAPPPIPYVPPYYG